jgi:transcriptional regulator with GAF, ATPase, and Fis domain
MNPRLLVLAGPRQGAACPITVDAFTIGRDAQNQLSLLDSSVSREHCLIMRQDTGFVIRDLGSHNGTLINGLHGQDRLLAHGDLIKLGRSVLQFLVGADLVFETSANDDEAKTVELLRADDAELAQKLEAPVHLHALLRISMMLHSFQAIYRERGTPARDLLERHLLELILSVIPAERGAILLYEDNLDEPSSLCVQSHDAAPYRPVVISRTLVKRVLNERCGLLIENTSKESDSVESLVAVPGKSLLVAPLLIREQACGIVYLEGAMFQETHLQLLVAISQIASMAMENAFHLEWLAAENQRLESELHPGHHMIGESEKLRELQRNIAKVAQTNSTVLIIGESGTGKELAARAIHQNSPRVNKSFIAVNCAALTETLLESELFGHEKGSFTGAVAQKKGRLELAEGGTMFLDEIGEMPPLLQAKLLRVLQERQMERVGGTHTIRLDIRLIAATNRNLEEEVRAGRFRQDLYYRLNVVTLKTPPLRHRQSDIPALAMQFAVKFGEQCGRRITGITPEAKAYLLHYEWPGNIRELENAIERAVVLGMGNMIQLEDLPESIREIKKPAGVSGAMQLQEAIDEAKRVAVDRAFEQAKNDHAGAAQLLGVHPNYLYRLVRNLGMR